MPRDEDLRDTLHFACHREVMVRMRSSFVHIKLLEIRARVSQGMNVLK